MKKNKILHLITGLEQGGAEMMLLKTLPLLQENFENIVCTVLKDGPMGLKLREVGIKTFHLNLSFSNPIGSIFLFRKILKDFQPEIMVTYLIHADLFGRLFGRLFGVKKIICSQRGSLLQWEFLRFFDRMTKCLVAKYIVQTKVAKFELSKKLNLPLEKFEVIPNSIDISEYEFELDKNAKKKELDINPENLNIVCVSNLRRSKGHEYLLKAFEDSYQKNKRVNLLIVGDGELREVLEEQVRKYNSKKNIYFLHERSDVKEILKISDVFVLPTLAEGMSNAIMEAMAIGLPVITTNIAVNKEVIQDHESGLLIPIKDTNAICKSIEDITQNPALKKKLSANARKKIIKEFSTKLYIEKITQLLCSI